MRAALKLGYRWRVWAAGAALALAAVLVVPVAGPAAAAGGASLALVPASGPPTTTTTARGSGFARGETVELSAGGQLLATATAGSDRRVRGLAAGAGRGPTRPV